MGVDRKSKHNSTLYVWVAPTWDLRELSFLEELPEALAVVLWRTVRRLRTWAAPGVRENAQALRRARGNEFEEDKAAAQSATPEIAYAIEVFNSAEWAVGDRRELVRACHEVSGWAERHGYLETSMQFAEAAAALQSEDPALANAAGRICRRAGESARAELWYARGVGLAREHQNRREYVSGHLGYAAVLRDAGHHSRALRWIRRAADTARRAGLRGKAAEAYHDAVGVSVLEQNINRAVLYARRALAVYPIHHRRFPAFAYDVCFLLVNRGLYSTALSLLSSTVGKIDNPAEQMVVWGTLARAAGGAGLRQRFQEAALRVLEMAPAYSYLGSGALYSAAEGARLMGDWETADDLVQRALSTAREHDSVVVLELAEALREDVDARRPGIPVADRRDPRAQILWGLAAEVRLRLARWRGPTWRPRRTMNESSPLAGHQLPEPSVTPPFP